MPTATDEVHVSDRILDAAEKLLGVYGYKKMTVDDLAREAGIGKGTVYLSFPSKEEVVLSTIDRLVERLTVRLAAILSDDSLTAEAKLQEMLVQRVLFRFDHVQNYSQSLNDLLSAVREGLLARRQQHFAMEEKLLAQAISFGLTTGELQVDDPRRTARLMLIATNSLLPFALSTREIGNRRKLESEVRDIAQLLVRGASSRKNERKA